MKPNYYLDIRSKDSRLISEKVHNENDKKVNQVIKLLKKTTVFNIVKKHIDEKNLIFILEKYFFELTNNLSSQIEINKLKNSNEIILDDYIHSDILKLYSTKKLKYKKTNKYYLNFLKIYFHFYKKKFYNLINYFYHDNKNISISTNISVQYAEGHDLFKKSDFAPFVNYPKIKKNIIVWFSDNSDFLKYKKKKDKNIYQSLKEYKVIKLPKNIFFKKERVLNNLEIELTNIRGGSLDSYIAKIFIKFISDIEFWYSFYKKFNIRISIFQNNKGLSNAFSYIALDYLNGCSIAKVKSIPNLKKGFFYNYYCHDIVFSWSKIISDEFRKYHKLKIKNFIISGFPYYYKNYKKKNHNQFITLKKIKKNFVKKGFKKTILLLDTNHSSNLSNQSQVIMTKDMINYYNQVLKFVNNNNLSLIVKSKKKTFFNGLISGIKKNLDISKKKENIHIITDQGYMNFIFEDIVDFAICVQISPSSSFYEWLLINKRGVVFDNSTKNKVHNLKIKNTYDNFHFLMNDLNKKLLNKKFGIWDYYKKNLNSYNDLYGADRIGEYIFQLRKNLNKNLSKNNAIDKTNNFFSKKYGIDKVQ
jgi:hypothetical protein